MRTRSRCCWCRAARPGASPPGCWPTGTSSMTERLRGPGSCGCAGACPRAHQHSAATAELGAAFGCCRLQLQGACWPWPLRQGVFLFRLWAGGKASFPFPWGCGANHGHAESEWGVLGTDPSSLARPEHAVQPGLHRPKLPENSSELLQFCSSCLVTKLKKKGSM
jgi:hypothetical protein